MMVQEKEPLSPLKMKGCKSLVICTLCYLPEERKKGSPL